MNPSQTEVFHDPLHRAQSKREALGFVTKAFQESVLWFEGSIRPPYPGEYGQPTYQIRLTVKSHHKRFQTRLYDPLSV